MKAMKGNLLNEITILNRRLGGNFGDLLAFTVEWVATLITTALIVFSSKGPVIIA